VLVGAALPVAKDLGWRMGSLLVGLYVAYVVLNLRHVWA
jgi:hypothetical protein